MKIRPSLALLLALGAGVLDAQDVPPAPATSPAQQAPAAQEAPAAALDPLPSELATLELARSRSCVTGLARLATLDKTLEPVHLRAARLQALDFAITREDSLSAAPFDAADPLEAAVRAWFAADAGLANQIVAGAGSEVQQQRTEARDQMRQQLGAALEALNTEAQEKIAAAGDIQSPTQNCVDAVFVRSAVLEACSATTSPLCDEARVADPPGQLRFVDSPEDLWNIEQLRPWTEPTPLFRTPDGVLGGARTGAMARRGNVILTVALEPLIRGRSSLEEAEALRFDAHLDSLGYTFDDPRFVMAPVLAVQFSIPGRVGGETHYLLHFGTLADPSTDLIWSTEPPTGTRIEAIFPVSGNVLNRLAAGEPVSITAVRMPEDADAEPIFSMALPSLGQVQQVTGLVTYMKDGQLAQDFAALVSPQTPEPAVPGGPVP